MAILNNPKIRANIQSSLSKMARYEENVNKKLTGKQSRVKTPDQLALLINPEDTESNPLTYSRLMEWLANTGWVYGYVRKRISPMDAHLYEDFSQTIWIEILKVKPETIMDVWYNGKGKFVNFIKRIIDIQLHSAAATYQLNKHFHHTHCMLTDEQWKNFEEGIETTCYDCTFPVKYSCPSGNRKKMVKIEHDVENIRADYEELTDNQIHYDL